MKIKVEGMGLPGSYDAWRTRAPYENEDPGMISKEDFFECTRDGSYDEEFLKYVKEDDPENLEKIKAGIKDAGTAIGSAIDQDIYSWKEIAEDVLDFGEAVEYYPGDMEDPDSVIDRRRDDKALGESFDFQKYLNEGWMHKTVDEAEDSNAPKVGTKAEDYAGEEVDIIDVLKLPAKQRDLDWFLDQYDDSGIMRDCYRDPEGYDFDPDEYDYYVAVEHPNLGETAVYVWGPEGVCYSGEDLKEGCHKVNELKREPKQATKSDLKGFASKEATLNRAKRAEKGNWKNSVGAFVEKHSAEIGEVSPLGKAALVNYIETKMKPELSGEAKVKVDELVNSSRTINDLMFALYNTMLKGAGMGLHECDEVDFLEEEDNFNNESYPKAEAWLEEHPNIKYFNEVPEQFLQYDINTEDDPDQENIETAVTEAGYMFVSELEAALEGGMDDEYLESCAMNGVINDPTYNPPIDSWDYRIR